MTRKGGAALPFSHLRISEQPIRATHPDPAGGFYCARHQWQFLDKYEMAENWRRAIFCSTARIRRMRSWHHIPQDVQAILAEKQAQLYVINAYRIAHVNAASVRGLIPLCRWRFFHLTALLPAAGNSVALFTAGDHPQLQQRGKCRSG